MYALFKAREGNEKQRRFSMFYFIAFDANEKKTIGANSIDFLT